MYSRNHANGRTGRNQADTRNVPSQQHSGPAGPLDNDQDPNSVNFSSTTGKKAHKVFENLLDYNQTRLSTLQGTADYENYQEEGTRLGRDSSADSGQFINNHAKIGADSNFLNFAHANRLGGSDSTLNITEGEDGNHLETWDVSNSDSPDTSNLSVSSINVGLTTFRSTTPRRLRFFSGNLGEPKRTPRPRDMPTSLLFNYPNQTAEMAPPNSGVPFENTNNNDHFPNKIDSRHGANEHDVFQAHENNGLDHRNFNSQETSNIPLQNNRVPFQNFGNVPKRQYDLQSSPLLAIKRNSTATQNHMPIGNKLKYPLPSSADDIEDDYVDDDIIHIDETQKASEVVEIGDVSTVHQFEDMFDSGEPVKETKFTNAQMHNQTSQVFRKKMSSNQHSSKPSSKLGDKTLSSEAQKPQSKNQTAESSLKSHNGKEYSQNSNNMSKKWRHSVRFQNLSDDKDALDSVDSSINTTSSGNRSAGSRTVTLLENLPVDEELTLGVIEEVFASISNFFKCIAFFLQQFFMRIANIFFKSPTSTFFSLLVAGVAVYTVLDYTGVSLIPSDSLFDLPTVSPSDLGELTSRLMAVEGTVSMLSRQTYDLENDRDTFQQHLDTLQNQLVDISKGMMLFDKKIGNLDASTLQTDKKLSEVESAVEELEKKLFDSHELMLEEHKLGKLRDEKIGHSQNRIFDMTSVVNDITGKIESLKTRVKYLEDAEKVEDIVVRTIDKILPPKIVVSVNSTTGDIHPTPEFWRFLEATFDSSIDKSLRLEEKVKKIVQNHPELLPSRISNDDLAEDFHEYTQKAIKNHFERFAREYQNGNNRVDSSTVVTRDVFTQMLRKEIEGMRDFTIDSLAALESRVKTRMGSTKQEVVDSLNNYQKEVDTKLRQVSQMEKDRAKRLESQINEYGQKLAKQQVVQTSDKGESAEPFTRKSILINGTTLALDNLIKKSIEKYILHTISKPDFADPATGSRVNSHLTSSSYDWKRRLPFLERQWRASLNVIGFGRMKINSPETAFNNDVNLGSCWPFNGPRGHVALSLGSVINPTDLGIIHVSADQSSDPTSAPRRVSLWVEVNDAELRKHISLLVDQSPGKADLAGDGSMLTGLSSRPFKVPANYVKILTAEYDLFSDDEFQVFPVPASVQQLGIKTKNVLFNIETNWGQPEFTCVYRLKLFGDNGFEKGSGRAPKESEVTTIRNRGMEDFDEIPDTDEYNDRQFVDGAEVVDNGGIPVEEDEFYINAVELMPGSRYHRPAQAVVNQYQEIPAVGGIAKRVGNKVYEKGKVIVKGSLNGYNFDNGEDVF